jgi:hypothetical protein
MYLRITRGRFDPANYDQVAALGGEVTAGVGRLPGLDRIYQALDRAAGTLVAVSTWDTAEHARWPRESLGELVARVRAVVELEPPEVWEVINHN